MAIVAGIAIGLAIFVHDWVVVVVLGLLILAYAGLIIIDRKL